MRQRKPKRKARLRRTPLKQGQEPLKRKKPLRAKKALTAKKGLARSTAKPLRVRPKRKLFDDREMRLAWRNAVVSSAPTVVIDGRARRVCPVCGEPTTRENRMQAHHVTTQEALRGFMSGWYPSEERASVEEALARLLWDARNGMPVCEGCHANHTTAKKRIPRRLVPEAAVEFARELDLDYLLDRYYA